MKLGLCRNKVLTGNMYTTMRPHRDLGVQRLYLARCDGWGGLEMERFAVQAARLLSSVQDLPTYSVAS